MRFGFLSGEPPKPSIPVDGISLEDREARERIVTALCEKRKALEWNLANLVHNNEEKRTLYEAELENHIEKMRVFGISEIDYAKFLAKEPEEVIH